MLNSGRGVKNFLTSVDMKWYRVMTQEKKEQKTP